MDKILNNLEELGLFTRRYSGRAGELVRAVKILHDHYCLLDLDNRRMMRNIKLIDLVSAYRRRGDELQSKDVDL